MLLYGASIARDCDGQIIKTKSGWTISDNKMYCSGSHSSTQARNQMKAFDFISSIDSKICNGQVERTDITRYFFYQQYNLHIQVKGRCINEQKNGNFTFFVGGSRKTFVTKFIDDKFVQTNCLINPANRSMPHAECFMYAINKL